MINFDAWHEVFATVRRNKLRAALTAFSVAWGIFMLVILQAAGAGLQKGVEYDFRDDALNSIWIRGGRTSLPYKGHAPGRRVTFTNEDLEVVKRQVPGIEYISGRYQMWGGFTVTYGSESANFDLRGTHPDHQYLEKTEVLTGRFMDDDDMRERRKVCVVGPPVIDQLFHGADPLGKRINVKGVTYTVIGTYTDQGDQNELNKIYIPISTAQLVYNGANTVHAIMFTVGNASAADSKLMEQRAKDILYDRHDINPDDQRALRINNNLDRFQKLKDVFDWIRIFVWIVASGTVVAGIVGVSNIMFIAVRERTREIGVRKALGAAPWSIVALIMREAVAITAAAGYLGLVGGLGIVELVGRFMPDNDYVRNPEVDLSVAVIATVIIVLAGAAAGFFPARTAARVNPVTALRS